MRRFLNHVVIVTGAASGIGRTTATMFFEEGATVIAVDIDPQGLSNLQESLRNPDTLETVVADVTDGQTVENMVAQAIQSHGQIDFLINNAGIEETDSVVNTTEAMWDRQMSVNVKSVFLCSKYVIPHMQQRRQGAIVNMGSIEGIVAEPNGSAYVASKGAIVMLTKEMALSFAQDGIRVNCVCPGWIDTPMARRSIDLHGGLDAMLPRIQELQPLGRLGQPEEVAKAILFLVSSDASFITGHSLMVDGGYTAQ